MDGSEKEIQSERFLSLENIFRGCILAEFPVDGELRQAAKERYGLDADEPIAIFAVWLGHHYEERYEELERLLEPCFSQTAEYESCMIHSARNRAVAVFFYHMRDVKAMERWCAGTVLPELDRAFALTPVFSWTVCEGLKDMPEGFARLMESRTWNLCFPEGILITSEMTAQVETVPLKYPLEIETQLKQAERALLLFLSFRFCSGIDQDGKGTEPVAEPDKDLRCLRQTDVLPEKRGGDIRISEQSSAGCR